ncbi:MAG: tetratricopeptide repeat protein [Polyangia bacterium]
MRAALFTNTACLLQAATFAACAGGAALDADTSSRSLVVSSGPGGASGSPLAYEHKLRADLLRLDGELEEAALHYRRALSADPDDFHLRVDLALTLIELERYEQAREEIAAAIESEPAAEYAWIALAELRLARGDVEEAERAALRAMRVEPGSREAELWLARLHLERGERRAAAELYRRAAAADPSCGAAHRGLGRIALQEGDWAAAVRHLRIAVSLEPARGESAAELAEAALKSSDPVAACEVVEAVLAEGYEPGASFEELREELVELLIEDGRWDRALRHLRTLPEPPPGDLAAAERRACRLERAGRDWPARERVVEAAGAAPAEARARLRLVEIELRLGRLETARLLLERFDWPAAYRYRAGELERALDRWPELPRPASCE